jgi:tRNA (pseudouridine54-N1)-methyltransferase
MTIFRHFYVKSHGVTEPEKINLKDMPGSSGRLDVVARCINAAFWLSGNIRRNVVFHTVLHGGKEPVYIRIEGERLRKVSPDERSISLFIKKALERKDIMKETSPGFFVCQKSFEEVVEENGDKELYLLDEKGEPIEDIKFEGTPFFFLGDNRDLTDEEKNFLMERGAKAISLGSTPYLSSHCIAVVNWWLDRKEGKQGEKVI